MSIRRYAEQLDVYILTSDIGCLLAFRRRDAALICPLRHEVVHVPSDLGSRAILLNGNGNVEGCQVLEVIREAVEVKSRMVSAVRTCRECFIDHRMWPVVAIKLITQRLPLAFARALVVASEVAAVHVELEGRAIPTQRIQSAEGPIQ